ncbi:MAG: triose-phosphate isomerase, partial [Firmicutes bacterium]|nr:triose-phosphate isomerase [Bacillota bacterium]
MSQYVDSKDFIEMSTEEDVFYATTNNEFIMVKVEEKIASLSSIDAVIDEYIGDRIPEGLLNKLPMKMVEDIYNPRVQKFIDQLNEAREAAENGEDKEDYPINSGIIFDIELVKEIMVPLMDYIKNSHEIALNKVIASENRVAELAEAYYINNPYASGSEAGYRGFVNGYIIPELYVEDLDSDGLYTIRSFVDIYEDAQPIVLYGGSLKASNADEILSEPSIDGGLIGGACLKIDEF